MPDGARCQHALYHALRRAGVVPAQQHRRPERPPAATADAAEAAEAVPDVGWMWQTGGGPGKASATRASLKQANIKAKK